MIMLEEIIEAFARNRATIWKDALGACCVLAIWVGLSMAPAIWG